jgi:membrane protein DedA with SNARE-associated domain
MLEKLITTVAAWILGVISSMHYGGIVLLMAIESACIPLPSEVIMPFAGFLVSKGEMTLFGIALAGAIGCVVGSIPAYYAGMFGGRPLADKFGKYLLIGKKDLDMADKWFASHGEIIIFLARLLPGIRTFIAFPAGMARMNMTRFIVYTFVGSFIWCGVLGYLGMQAGQHWAVLGQYFHQFHYVLAAAGLAFVAWYIWQHFKHD